MISRFYKSDDRQWNSGRFPILLGHHCRNWFEDIFPMTQPYNVCDIATKKFTGVGYALYIFHNFFHKIDDFWDFLFAFLYIKGLLKIESNLDGSNTDGSFTMANSNSFLSPYEILPSSRKQIFKEIFLFYREIVCCVYSLESPLRGDSNEYTQHTITV